MGNATYKWGEPKECNKCKLTRYSEKFCENCISLHLQELFNTWTSGNDIIDNFIQKCQKLSSLPNYTMEWIPFDQFKKVKYLVILHQLQMIFIITTIHQINLKEKFKRQHFYH